MQRWHIVDGRKVAVHWSAEDGGYIATAPSLPGCSAFGHSEVSAAREAHVAVRAWIEACEAAGNPVPPPDWRP